MGGYVCLWGSASLHVTVQCSVMLNIKLRFLNKRTQSVSQTSYKRLSKSSIFYQPHSFPNRFFSCRKSRHFPPHLPRLEPFAPPRSSCTCVPRDIRASMHIIRDCVFVPIKVETIPCRYISNYLLIAHIY